MLKRPEPAIGKCPMCRGKIREGKDEEDRKWGVCDECGLRVSLYSVGNPVAES